MINRELHGDFNLKRFEHWAWFNTERSRIEMHLKCNEDLHVRIQDLDMEVSFKKGETLLTEISRKFTPESLTHLLNEGGLQIHQHFEAPDHYFSLVLAQPI